MFFSYNATGHWLSTLRLERDTPLPSRPAVILLDVRPSATRCGNARTDALLVTLQGIKGENDDEEMSQFFEIQDELQDDSAAEAGTGAVVAGGRCSATAAQLTVTTSHNATGHWLAALRLERRTRLPSRPAVVVLDVRPSATRCAGVRHDTLLVTLQGETLEAAGYARWQQNQPDSRGKENCGSVYVSTMGLNDLHCTTFKAPFVCEQIVG
ncbi:Putative LPSBP6 [Gryllus bimaculatus]|nr:Putative LPSBP6 [Gryllus bimaculatus]